MSSFHRLLAAMLCVSALSAAATPAACVAPAAPTDEAAVLNQASARLLAGLPPDGADGKQIAEQPFWLAHSCRGADDRQAPFTVA